MKKWRKRFLILLSVVVALVVLIIVFISPITKYLVEKYDVEYTGREIKMDWAYVNPFTGYIHFEHLKIFEHQSDSLFIDMAGLTTRVGVWQLWQRKLELHTISLDAPTIRILQNKKQFNFSDLIQRFTLKKLKIDSLLTVKKGFDLPRIELKNATVYYSEKVTPIDYFIKNVVIQTSQKRANTDTVIASFAFQSGIGTGDVRGELTANIATLDYRYTAKVHDFDLQLLAQYAHELTHFGKFKGKLNADARSAGNFNNPLDMTTSGVLSLSEFHFGKTEKEDYAAFDRLTLGIRELSPINKKYSFDSMVLHKPHFKYERYDRTNNLDLMFGKNGAKYSAIKADPEKFNLVIELGKYVSLISRNFLKSNFKIDRLAITQGDLRYNDFSLSEKFSIGLHPLFIRADSITKNQHRMTIHLVSGFEPYGEAKITLRINPKDTGDFEVAYNIQKIPATLFNPYILARTSYPLDRGTVEMNGNWTVRSGKVNSTNHLLVIDPRVTKKVPNEGSQWLPAPLIMAFVRERGNIIDYDIPMSGSLKNPHFTLKDAIWDLIRNIFVKPITIPYGVKVHSAESKIEKLLTVSWAMRRSELTNNQKDFIQKMADFLQQTPEARIVIYPQWYAEKEKEYILFYAAKQKYYLAAHGLTAAQFSQKDSIKVEKMAIRDSLFSRYLNAHVNQAMAFTLQDKCEKFLNENNLEKAYKALNARRAENFMRLFKEKGLTQQIRIAEAKTVLPYNGFSFYKVRYNGILPDDLYRANQDLDRFDDEAPRNKFAAVRKKIGGVFNFLFRKKTLSEQSPATKNK